MCIDVEQQESLSNEMLLYRHSHCRRHSRITLERENASNKFTYGGHMKRDICLKVN